MTGQGKNEREERLVKALRDNLRRRKASPGEAVKERAAKKRADGDAALPPKRQAKPKPPS